MSTHNGFVSELMYKVREEVLGTRFYWTGDSGVQPTTGSERLCRGIQSRIDNVEEALGDDFAWQCVRVAPLGWNTGWSHELALRGGGQGGSDCVDEMMHINLSRLSRPVDGRRITNRNQIAGMPRDLVVDGKIASSVIQIWLDEMNAWAVGNVTNGGTQFFLASHNVGNNGRVFERLERFRASPFAGMRKDRTKNTPSRRGCPVPA